MVRERQDGTERCANRVRDTEWERKQRWGQAKTQGKWDPETEIRGQGVKDLERWGPLKDTEYLLSKACVLG